MVQTIDVVSYNILAKSYVKPEWFKNSDPSVLDWHKRKFSLLKTLINFNSDIICLQEIEPDVFNFVYHELKALEYVGFYGKKNNKPDGCASFYKNKTFEFINVEALYYQDKETDDKDSGHLALILDLKIDSKIIKIVNTHIRWENQESKEKHIGYREIKELNTYISSNIKADGWIICGDFNAKPDSFVIKELMNNRLIDAYSGQEQNTCNPNGQAKRIDYIFHSSNFESTPIKIREIDDLTPLPSEEEPSDHLAIRATLKFMLT